jgi:hypothetical protein
VHTEVTNFAGRLLRRAVDGRFYDFWVKPRPLQGVRVPGIGIGIGQVDEDASVPQYATGRNARRGDKSRRDEGTFRFLRPFGTRFIGRTNRGFRPLRSLNPRLRSTAAPRLKL